MCLTCRELTKAVAKWDCSATECACMYMYIYVVYVSPNRFILTLRNSIQIMTHSYAHISMNEGAAIYRIIKEYACKNF